jgi:hypothetical protein
MTHGEFCLFANTGLSQKGLGRRIGSSILKRGTRVAALDLDARDADGDLIAQEGTTAAHRVTKKKPKSRLQKIRTSAALANMDLSLESLVRDLNGLAEQQNRLKRLASILGLDMTQFKFMRIKAENVVTHREKIRKFADEKFGELKTGTDAHKALSKVFPNADILLKRNQTLSTHDLATIQTLLFYGTRDPHLANSLLVVDYKSLGGNLGGGIGPKIDYTEKKAGLHLQLNAKSVYDGSVQPNWFTASSAFQDLMDEGATEDEMSEYFAMYTVMHEWGHGLHFEAIMRKELGITAEQGGAERFEQIQEAIMKRSQSISRRFAIMLSSWMVPDNKEKRIQENIDDGIMLQKDLDDYRAAKMDMLVEWVRSDSMLNNPVPPTVGNSDIQKRLTDAGDAFYRLTGLDIDTAVAAYYDETTGPSSPSPYILSKAMIEAAVRQSSTFNELFANIVDAANQSTQSNLNRNVVENLLRTVINSDWWSVLMSNAYDKTPEEDMEIIDASLHSISRYASSSMLHAGYTAFEQFAEIFAAKELGLERSASSVRKVTQWGSTKSFLSEEMRVKAATNSSDPFTRPRKYELSPFPPIPLFLTCRGISPLDPIHDGLYGGPKNPKLGWLRRFEGKTR